jgi:polysaccharide export outer membrane protein
MGGAIAAVLTFLMLASCAPPAGNPPVPPRPRAPSAYRIVPGDVLEILVWREETISGPVTVRPDGMVSVSLIGDVQAEGTTPEELSGEIEKRLLRFIESPKVVVRVGQSARRFYVVGNVNSPGMYSLLPQQTLVQAIALSGGFSQFADRGSIRIMRQAGPQVEAEYDYDRIVSGADPDVMLETNDTIVVP